MKLKIVCEDKYKPEYANDTDACMDLKARITKDSGLHVHTSIPLKAVIMPGETAKVPSGVQAAVPEGYVMKMYVRSSIGIKKNLVLANGTGIIDAGYRDEIIMALHNIGSEPVEIFDGDRLCQFIILPYPKLELEQVNDNEDFRTGDRGGGIGSTGI